MHEYEIFIEEINPCGGEKYSKKTLIEAEADSPEAYVKEYGRFPVLESTHNESGDVVIVKHFGIPLGLVCDLCVVKKSGRLFTCR